MAEDFPHLFAVCGGCDVEAQLLASLLLNRGAYVFINDIYHEQYKYKAYQIFRLLVESLAMPCTIITSGNTVFLPFSR